MSRKMTPGRSRQEFCGNLGLRRMEKLKVKRSTKKNRDWFYLMLVAMCICWSCQHSRYEEQGSLSQVSTADTTVDSTTWLKETRGIRDILEDSQGNLWFSSPDYIARFNGTAIQYFSEKDGLTIVGHLHEDKEGAIWVEDGSKIFRYVGDRFKEEKLGRIQSSADFWFQRSLSASDTTYISPGIYHLDHKGIEFLPYPIEKDVNNKFLYFPSTKASIGKDGTIWVGTMEKVFGIKDHSFIAIGREEMGRQNDERQMGIRGIFVDSKGVLWKADNGAGIFTYNGKETINFTKRHRLDHGDVEGNTLHRAFSIAEDTTGLMWFGTVYSGIWRYNPETNEFKNYTRDDGVKSENIWTIYKTNDGELLFAGETPGAIYRFNGNGFSRIH